MCVSVCVTDLLAPWRAGVGWWGAGDVQRAGATAGGGGASNPKWRDTGGCCDFEMHLIFPNYQTAKTCTESLVFTPI